MPLSPKKQAILQTILKVQQDAIAKIQERERRKQEIEGMGLLTEEVDPYFQRSPAATLGYEDIAAIRMLPETIAQIEKQEGPPGKPGYTPKKGKDYFDGKDGYTPKKGVDYFDGQDATVSKMELMEIADAEVEEHKKQFDHTQLHRKTMLGEYELEESTVQEGDLLQVKGKKLVGVKMPKVPQQNQFMSSTRGGSTLRSILVTASRQVDEMGIYIVDATSGNIAITLPSAAGREEYMYELIRIDSSTNTVTITPTGSETMSGMTDYVMQQWTDIRLFAYNGNYLIRSAG